MSNIKKDKFSIFNKSNINKDNKKMNHVTSSAAKSPELFNKVAAQQSIEKSAIFATQNKEQAPAVKFINNMDHIEACLKSGDVASLKGLPADKLTAIYALITSYRNSHH